MENLPTELHMQIIAFCSECELEDGTNVSPGSSIRALRSVSKYLSAVAQPWLYHTVCVRGIRQATTFVQRLELDRPSRVHNLLLSDDIHTTENPSRATDCTIRSEVKTVTCTSPASLTRARSMSNATLTTLTRLLTLCGPSLRALSISITSLSSPTLLARLFRMHFPELRFLSISGFYPFPSTSNAFPKLRTLKLYGNPNPSGLLAMGALEDACPVLEHLEVGGIKGTSCFRTEVEQAVWKETPEKIDEVNFVRETDSGIGGHASEDEEEVFPPCLPKNVRSVVIQSLADANTTLPTTAGVTQHPGSTPDHTHVVQLTFLPAAPAPSIDQLKSAWISASALGG